MVRRTHPDFCDTPVFPESVRGFSPQNSVAKIVEKLDGLAVHLAVSALLLSEFSSTLRLWNRSAWPGKVAMPIGLQLGMRSRDGEMF